MSPNDSIPAILQSCRTVAVVGLSPKTWRDSHGVARYMQAQGWRIIPVNPNCQQPILGETVYPDLLQAAKHARIDLVNVFRNSVDVPPVAQQAIAIGAKALWLQLGIAHEPSAQAARAAGLAVVQDRCLKVEHAANSPHGVEHAHNSART